jgi:hypothetical protein
MQAAGDRQNADADADADAGKETNGVEQQPAPTRPSR